ncbi:13763_t:CDS:2, partial [Funneliformis geosporum]
GYTRPAIKINNITKFRSSSSILSRHYGTKKYTKDHEWINIDNGVGIVGITDFAQTALGDVVFVEVPEVGKVVKKSGFIGAVESVKAASDIYAPVSGKVTESNDKLTDEPGLINKSPESDELSDPKELDELLDETAYKETTSTH